MKSHICENSPAKAEIRRNITSTVQTYSDGFNRRIGNGIYPNYASLCGAECTQEKDLKDAIPEARFWKIDGFETSKQRAKKAEKTGIMSNVIRRNIDKDVHLDEGYDIIYFDYCCTPLKHISSNGASWKPLASTMCSAKRDAKHHGKDTLLFFTFSLRCQGISTDAIFNRWFESVKADTSKKWQENAIEQWNNSGKRCTDFANVITSLFHNLKGVKVVMNRVYRGGDGGSKGLTMMTIGVVVTQNQKAYDFTYQHLTSLMVHEIEHVGNFNRNRKKSPVMVNAGKKAWKTRRENEKKRQG